MITEIQTRHSTRRFAPTPLSQTLLDEILYAGTLAPSPKNRKPWAFITVMDTAKTQMSDAFRAGLEREKTRPFLLESAAFLCGAERTLRAMQDAPVTVFVVNTRGTDPTLPCSTDARIAELCDVQSIGAAIQNMTLTAEHLGIAGLWIGDFFFAYPEIKEWLKCDGVPVAALALGYAEKV